MKRGVIGGYLEVINDRKEEGALGCVNETRGVERIVLELFSLVHGIIFVLALQIFAFRGNLLTKFLACASLSVPRT